MQALLKDAGLENDVLVESAGTGAWHVGERADARSRAAALKRGVHLLTTAQQFTLADFDRFDYVSIVVEPLRDGAGARIDHQPHAA